MTPPQLLMVSGSVWGAGKSTLAAALARDLAARGHQVRLSSEDDLLAMDAFAHFERLLGPTDPETHRADLALLDAARSLVEEALALANSDAYAAPPVVIVDPLLPGFFWLVGRYDRPRVQAFGQDLARVLSPLRPVLVYLRGDPTTLVARAAAERGSDWPARMATWVSRWTLPHYPNAPLSSLEDVLRFWTWLDTQTISLFATWPVPTIIPDATQPVPELAQQVLADARVTEPPTTAERPS